MPDIISTTKKFGKKPLLYVVDGDDSYAPPWLRLFDLTGEYDKADCFLFTGGADINPALYGDSDTWNLCSFYDARDKREVPFFHYAVAHNIPIIAICRGAQLVCALTGGKLFHDVSGHAGIGGHPIYTYDHREILNMSSLHHQMLRPAGNFQLLAWSDHLSRFYATADDQDNDHPDFAEGDPEIVWYPDVKALCIQGHPEFMADNSEAVIYCRELASTFILQGE